MEELMSFFSGSGIWVYAFIFFGKIAEVALSTLRIVLISRGERVVGTMVSLFEVVFWIFVTGTVVVGFQEDVYKVVFFVIAFAVGNFFGSFLEEKLAFGLCAVQILVPANTVGASLAQLLRSHGFGITTMKAMGMEEEREVLMLMLKRKRSREAIELVNNFTDNAVITVSDVKSLTGGYIRPSGMGLVTSLFKK